MARRGTVRRTRRSAQEWSTLISQQSESGQSQREFCESRGLALSSFANAKRRAAPGASQRAGDEFVAIPLVHSAHTCWEVELSLGEGVVLRLRGA